MPFFYGLREDLEEFKAYVLGGSKVPYIYYKEDGNWEAFLPAYENQTTRLSKEETSGCTVHGSQNQVETFLKFLTGVEANYSERFTYLMVPVSPQRGADPQDTHEAIRKHGLVEERFLPMADTLEEYLDTSDITGSLKAKALNWLERYDYRHEWLWNSPSNRPENYIDILKDALKTSPIAVSVSAWRKEGDVYVSTGNVNNHYCLLYTIDNEGYPWVFDSYDHSKKKLAKDHNIRRAKRIWINPKIKSGARKHIGVLQAIVNRLMNKKTLLDICDDNIGRDVTPLDNTPDEVACAEVVTTILRAVYPEVPKEVSTIRLDKWLSSSKTFVRILDPEPGAIIISPTASPDRVGHVGFCMADGTIASNTSYGVNKGKFIKNYTPQTWKERYQKKLGLEVHLYKHV